MYWSFVVFAGSCQDIVIGSVVISQGTIYSFRAKQKWTNLYAELQDGKYMLKVFVLFCQITFKPLTFKLTGCFKERHWCLKGFTSLRLCEHGKSMKDFNFSY
jgi:hypothetical protein